ncbi:MAG: hypothetical protein Q4P08_06270 [Eubacteriales bacterium]|nr:hypothetical protein [Eubacteriales bacterium]
MPNNFNYVEQFRTELEQKYTRELASGDLKDNGVQFIGAKTVRIPRLILGGYGEHSRSGGWQRKGLPNGTKTSLYAERKQKRAPSVFFSLFDNKQKISRRWA